MALSPRSKSSSTLSMVMAADSPCPCKIWRDNAVLDDSNKKALPGEQIVLEIKCDAGNITDVQWTIPGVIFWFYSPGDNTAFVAPVTELDKKQKKITFCWADTGLDREVKVTFKLDGKDCENTGKLDVIKPDSSLSAVMGTVGFNSDMTEVGLQPPPPPSSQIDGIKFFGTVSIPPGSGVSAGQWEYIQTTKGTNRIHTVDHTCKINPNANTVQLDTQLPYAGPWAADGSQRTAQDSPVSFLEGTEEELLETRWEKSVEFWMYIMFKSDRANSNWVPLRVLHWKVNWCAGRLTPFTSWELHQAGQDKDGPVETTEHPIWESRWGASPLITEPCPPFCTPD